MQNVLTHQGEVPSFYFEILDLLSNFMDNGNFMFSLLENFGEIHSFVDDVVLYRGYYMPARGYEFYLRVVNSISHE